MTGFSSSAYWQKRYQKGGNSGAGSYGRLSVYKANFINTLVEREQINSVIEFGSGDGNQASLFELQKYTGVDISKECVETGNNLLGDRKGWSFKHVSEADEPHDMSMSLDVIYHLVEDVVFHDYMTRLFAASEKFVLIYASNFDEITRNNHVRHRNYSTWIEQNCEGWSLKYEEPNPFGIASHGNPQNRSFASFKLFEKG